MNISGWSSAFTMTGGTISYNTIGSWQAQGGGVYVGGTFTMSGGTISHNTAGNSLSEEGHGIGGGVFVGLGATFNLSGNPIIVDNNDSVNPSNLGLQDAGKSSTPYTTTIRITGELTYTNPIGVMKVDSKGGGGLMPTPGVFTDGWTTYMSDKTPADYFISESTYPVEKQGNELVLAAPQPISYQAASWDSSNNKVTYTTESCDSYTVVTSSTTSFEDGKWYVVKDDVSINHRIDAYNINTRITVNGTANLILCDGATLTADSITATNATLNIYGQSAGTGELKAESYVTVGIGCTGGTVNIHGGTVTANGNGRGAGIGGADGESGADGKDGGTVTIYGGTVTASNTGGGAGIGGGGSYSKNGGTGGTVTIYGGTVRASGGAGIGGGDGEGNSGGGVGGAGGTVTIYGGEVTANGFNGAGIGGGSGSTAGGDGGTVAICGGTVKANGCVYNSNGSSVGIGGGSSYSGSGKGTDGTLTLGTGLYLYGGTSANPETDLSNHVAQSNGDYARSQYMTVNNLAPHTHSFTYSASGATITATCDGTGTCDITDGLELTIIAPTGSLVYDGTTTYPATLSTGYSTTAFPDTYTISYTKDGSAYNGLPKDAGAYTASITVGTGDAAKTASVDFTIAKENAATVTEAPTAKNLTYNGSAQELVTAGTATDGEMQYALGTKEAATEDYTASIPTATEAGTYYVWYKAVGDSDHLDSDPECVVVKINEAEKEEVISDIESGEDKESEKEEVISDNDSSEETGFVKDVTEEISESTDSLKTKIENSSDLKAALDLKDDEITEGVRVWLYVRDAEGTAPEEDKELVQSTAGESTVGMYLDITLFKQVGGNDEVKVTETSKAIKASILIPESLRKSGRTFEIIRVHNGEATVIPGNYDESTGIFTFETDKFSTYALVYKETAENAETSDDTDDGDSEVNTEDSNEDSTETVSYKEPEYPLYRLYNTRTGEHFFTMSEEERDYWIERSAETGWTSENIAWYVRKDTGIPVYRVFDANRTGQHRFTSDVNERDEYLNKGWVDEGIGWYSSGSDGKTVYKLKHPTAKKHYYHYTIYEEERDTLLAQGWTLEESGFTAQ
ncbi:MAG: hypothetical protein IJ796_02965 [Lachnospiraceae bacterium]|nr:hypothetical protein [Lachnospiraceae bacterium]